MNNFLIVLSLLTLSMLQGCAGTVSRAKSVFDIKEARTEELRKWVRPDKGQRGGTSAGGFWPALEFDPFSVSSP